MTNIGTIITTQHFRQNYNEYLPKGFFLMLALFGVIAVFGSPAAAQGPVSGGFEGTVKDITTDAPIVDAIITFKNLDTG